MFVSQGVKQVSSINIPKQSLLKANWSKIDSSVTQTKSLGTRLVAGEYKWGFKSDIARWGSKSPNHSLLTRQMFRTG